MCVYTCTVHGYNTVYMYMYMHCNVLVPPPPTDSGVGAGIDSYYEYCLKSYILLGDHEYLQRFDKVHHTYMYM